MRRCELESVDENHNEPEQLSRIMQCARTMQQMLAESSRYTSERERGRDDDMTQEDVREQRQDGLQQPGSNE